MLAVRRLSRTAMAQAKKVLVLVADGSEEIETVTVVDVLRRGGLEVTLAGLNGSDAVTCSRGVKLVPDVSFSSVDRSAFDAVVLPGGMAGAKAFAASDGVKDLLRLQEGSGKLVSAICAAPIALHAAGVGSGKRITSHPSVKSQIEGDVKYTEERVASDGNIITSRGPGTSMEFALALVERLQGADKRVEIEKPMLVA